MRTSCLTNSKTCSAQETIVLKASGKKCHIRKNKKPYRKKLIINLIICTLTG
jgi:hypothetical protein